MKNRNGFSLIEILGVITILGILSVMAIVAFSHLIENSKDEKLSQEKRTLLMAAKSYYQDNRDKLPKNIGDDSYVYAKDLLKKNYLKEEIKNKKNESCMKESYVLVHKDKKVSYIYRVYLYCGNEKPSENDENSPTITIKLTNSKQEDITENQIKDIYSYIKITGGVSKKTGKNLYVEGYQYSISVKNNYSDYRNVYNSGSLSGNMQEEVIIIKGLDEYINIADNNTIFKISIKATNSEGKKTSLDINPMDAIRDRKAPICDSNMANQAAIEDNPNTWINAEKYHRKEKRSITVICSDKDGSGCIRSKFTRTWPIERSNYESDAEYGYIKIIDNVGNTNITDNNYLKNPCKENLIFKNDTCRVRVKVDTTYPKAIVKAYKRTNNGTKENNTNVIKSNVNTTAGGSRIYPNQTLTISKNSYNNSHNNWLNKTYYPNGIIYEIAISDNIHLLNWKWETNKPNITDSSNEYNTYRSGLVGENNEKLYPDLNHDSENCGPRQDNILVDFRDQGMRKGRLTITDRAGNKTIIIIEANIDYTNPTVSCSLAQDSKYIKDSDNKIAINDNAASDTGTSGIDNVYYTFTNFDTSKQTRLNEIRVRDKAVTYYGYVTATDKAGNSSGIATCSGYLHVPAKCDSIEYSDWGTCTKKCGTGSQTREKISKYNGGSCGTEKQDCNTYDCCSKVYHKECNVSCGDGIKKAYSDYDNSRCKAQDKPCKAKPCTEKRYFCRNQCPDNPYQAGCLTGSTYSWTCNGGCDWRVGWGTLHTTHEEVTVTQESNGWYRIVAGNGVGEYIRPGCVVTSKTELCTHADCKG